MEITLVVGDHAGAIERPSSIEIGPFRWLERLLQTLAAFQQPPAGPPEPGQCPREPDPGAPVLGARPIECQSEVLDIQCQPLQPRAVRLSPPLFEGSIGHFGEELEMAVSDVAQLAVHQELLATVFTECF